MILWGITIRNFFRYTQFMHRWFKKNPFQNEKTPQFLAVGSFNDEHILGAEPEFFNKKDEWFHNWKLLRKIVASVVLLIPRIILILAGKMKSIFFRH